MKKFKNILRERMSFRRWIREEDATAFTEAVLLFPIMSTLLMGVFDIGMAITANQKTIGAAQIIGDLIARDRSVTKASMGDIIRAGELAIEPYSLTPFGYDIVSISFNDKGMPEVLWRMTKNTLLNNAAVDSTKALGSAGDGIVVVTAAYNYKPFFYNFIKSNINMKEVAFLHGRRSATVACTDCPK